MCVLYECLHGLSLLQLFAPPRRDVIRFIRPGDGFLFCTKTQKSTAERACIVESRILPRNRPIKNSLSPTIDNPASSTRARAHAHTRARAHAHKRARARTRTRTKNSKKTPQICKTTQNNKTTQSNTIESSRKIKKALKSTKSNKLIICTTF